MSHMGNHLDAVRTAANADPRSVQFRRQREAEWRRLDILVDRALRRGMRHLSEDELYRLPQLYRSAMASLSVARRTAMDRRLIAYLEALTARAYLVVYGTRRSTAGAIRRFVWVSFPQQVRSLRLELGLTMFVLVLATTVAWALTASDPAWFYAFVNDELAAGRTPEASYEELYEPLYATGGGDGLLTFSSSLFTHNARIGLTSFALGIAAGVPTALIMFLNGLMLGGFTALYADNGLLFKWGGWILPHGVPEIGALVLCGAAGLHIGRALIWPGRRTVADALSDAGKRGACVAIGAVILFAIAGLIEGVFRQTVQHDGVRYAFAVFNLTWLMLWLFVAGRGMDAQEGEVGG